MVIFVISDLKSWHSVKEIKEKWQIWWFEIQKVGIQTKDLWKNGEFVDFRFEKWQFWWFEIQKVGIQTKDLWKNGEFGDFWWYLGGLKWSEGKKWSLRFKKLDLGHVKEKMLTQIELSGKMGWGDQELSRSTEFQNFWVVVKVNEVNLRLLKLRKGLGWLGMTF